MGETFEGLILLERDPSGHVVVTVETRRECVKNFEFQTLSAALHWAHRVLTERMRPIDLRGPPR